LIKGATRLISAAILAGLTALSPAPAASAQEAGKDSDPIVDEIIASYLEAIGGLEANERLDTRRMEGTITLAAVGTPWRSK
jgi:hypothetical protein